MMKKLLVIDDEFGTRESLKEVFCENCDVLTAENGMEGLRLLSKHRADLIILDLVMPGLNGVSFLKEVREIYPDVPVIMISASSADGSIKDALRAGAIGFVRKPFDVEELRHLVQQSLTASELPRQRELLHKELVREFPLLNMVGQSRALRKLVDEARKATASHVLLVGERGTGREFLARQIHSWSPRASEPFVVVRCCALPPSFLEGEIFGSWDSSEGQCHRGALDLAAGSSLLLEEVDRLPHPVQLALIRLLEHGEYQRVGSRHVIPSTVRVLVTLDRLPAEAVKSGALLPEVASLLSRCTIELPPLRDRREDIPVLAYHFLHELRLSLNAATLDIEPETMQKLRDYSWPGNVRELRNVIERMLVLAGGEKCLKVSALPKEFGEYGQPLPESGTDFEQAVNAFERQLIVGALQRAHGTIKGAAEILRTTPRILQYRIEKLQIRKTAA